MLKAKKRSFCLVLTLVMLLATACGAWAIEPNAEGVYEIGTADELAAFRDGINGGTISADSDAKLTANITMPSDPWMPIGTFVHDAGGMLDYVYRGTFDGNGKTIQGLTLNASKYGYCEYPNGGRAAALFGFLAPGAIVQNLVLTDVDIDFSSMTSERAYTAALVGIMDTGVKIKNCGVIGGSIKGSADTSGGQSAGLVGYASWGDSVHTAPSYTIAKISDCYVTGLALIEGSQYVGGLAATINSGTVVSNSFVSDIDVIRMTYISEAGGAGGLTGFIQQSVSATISEPSTLKNCYAQGIGSIEGLYVGGLIGRLLANATDNLAKVENCVYVVDTPAVSAMLSGDSSVYDSYEGGIIGRFFGEEDNLELVENGLYPINYFTFQLSGTDKPYGNISSADVTSAATYDPTSDDADLPAIVAALDRNTAALGAGETLSLLVSTYPGTSGDITYTWSVDDGSVASVEGSGASAVVTALAGGSATVTVTIGGDLDVTLSCIVNVTEIEPVITGEPLDGIYEGESVDLTYDFTSYTIVGVDDSGMETDRSGLRVEYVVGGTSVTVKGEAKEAGTYFYVVTFQRTDGSTFTQTVYVTVEGGSRPTSYGGSGSSNCNAGMGASALLALLGLAVVVKRK